jgi:hypothetical protein
LIGDVSSGWVFYAAYMQRLLFLVRLRISAASVVQETIDGGCR